MKFPFVFLISFFRYFFRYNSRINIYFPQVFHAMGLGGVFSEDADFSGFSTTSNIKFNDAIHKAKIEIDENGSKAAAATAMFMFRSSRPLEPFQFFCNHPFLFMIYDHKTRAILFAGIYRGPE